MMSKSSGLRGKIYMKNSYNQPIDFKVFEFSGGEVQVQVTGRVNAGGQEIPDALVRIYAKILSSADLMTVLLLKNALDIIGVGAVSLECSYLPYARQDRVMDTGESFSLIVFAQLINSANFSQVHVLDPHSDVGPALLNNCVIHSNLSYVEWAVKDINSALTLIVPDAGARKKADKLAQDITFSKVVQAGKTRDTRTGALKGFEVYADDLEGKDCIIVDDICDGGGTFIGLAKELKAKNAGKLYLFVTHGIFSKGVDVLTEHFEHIYTTDSVYSQLNTDKVTGVTQYAN